MNAQINYIMGMAIDHLQKSNWGDAERLLKQALKMMPKNTEALRLLGVVYAQRKDSQEALKMFDASIKCDPNNWLSHSNRGNVLKELRQYEFALKSYDRAIALNPNYAEVYNNKGNLLKELNRYDEALNTYDRAIELDPNCAEVHGNVGNTLQNLNQYASALLAYQRGIALGSDKSINLGSLVHCRMRLCDWSGIAEQLNKIEVEDVGHSAKIHPFHLLPFLDNPFLIRKYSQDYVSGEYPVMHDLQPIGLNKSGNKIRLGYFSADFRNHPVSFLVAGMLEAHDKERFEVFGFSTYTGQHDEMTSRLMSACDQFIDVSEKSDKAIAELSRELNIDIAIDLGGITQDARLGIFAYRAAPIQIGYIGYLGTLGVPYMDYIIADDVLIPEEFQGAYSEKIMYLPSYQANDPKRPISSRVFTREELGLPKQGFIYCCFNNNYKFTPKIFDSWAKILKQVEGSVLLLYAESDAVSSNLCKEIELRGVDSSRLIFAGRVSRGDYLARYRVADLFLDTSPYNAGTTASDALWAGLPVLTFIGKSFSARMGASLLNAIGLPELVASSQDEYEALAIELGRNSEKYLAVKEKLAANRLTTPLFNTEEFTKSLETAYLKAYSRYHLGLNPEHIQELQSIEPKI